VPPALFKPDFLAHSERAHGKIPGAEVESAKTGHRFLRYLSLERGFRGGHDTWLTTQRAEDTQ
jgi:hypothetical protein